MKLFVVKVVNGNIEVNSEWESNPNGAIMSFHQLCATLWNAADVYEGDVKILDEQLNLYGNYWEHITHPRPEPEQ